MIAGRCTWSAVRAAIITGGENVCRPEMKYALTTLDEIEACAVVGALDHQ
jgi:hypothetical protein